MTMSSIKDCRPKSRIYLPYSPSTCRLSRIETKESAPPRASIFAADPLVGRAYARKLSGLLLPLPQQRMSVDEAFASAAGSDENCSRTVNLMASVGLRTVVVSGSTVSTPGRSLRSTALGGRAPPNT